MVGSSWSPIETILSKLIMLLDNFLAYKFQCGLKFHNYQCLVALEVEMTFFIGFY